MRRRGGRRDRDQEGPWEAAKRRKNVMIFAKLAERASGTTFAIATYHMPCVFYNPPVMTIHGALALQRVQV